MSERWARAVLSTFRWMGAAAYTLIGGYVAWRASRGKEETARRGERYGKTPMERPPGQLIWMHAASVGETIAVVPLIEHILDYEINVVLTTVTVTSAQVAKERLGERVVHQYVPLDLKPAVSRFLDHWLPDLAIIAESEIWPMTILELGARRVPQVLVNGRLSDNSFASWKKRSYLAEALFENLSHVVAQSDLDAERYRVIEEVGRGGVPQRVGTAGRRVAQPAQGAVDDRRTTAVFADALSGDTFDDQAVGAAAAQRVKTAERLRDAVVAALRRIHALLTAEQRAKLAYLIRTGAIAI